MDEATNSSRFVFEKYAYFFIRRHQQITACYVIVDKHGVRAVISACAGSSPKARSASLIVD